jgi:hypothetical protein
VNQRRQTPPPNHTVYIVHWPDIGVIKAGYTGRKRWRTFVNRGAQIVDLVPFDNSTDAFEFESMVHRRLSSLGPLAFTSATEASPYLGRGGGGWCECYRMPDGVTPMELLTSTDWSTV